MPVLSSSLQASMPSLPTDSPASVGKRRVGQLLPAGVQLLLGTADTVSKISVLPIAENCGRGQGSRFVNKKVHGSVKVKSE